MHMMRKWLTHIIVTRIFVKGSKKARRRETRHIPYCNCKQNIKLFVEVSCKYYEKALAFILIEFAGFGNSLRNNCVAFWCWDVLRKICLICGTRCHIVAVYSRNSFSILMWRLRTVIFVNNNKNALTVIY